jgi:hypothetical protein
MNFKVNIQYPYSRMQEILTNCTTVEKSYKRKAKIEYGGDIGNSSIDPWIRVRFPWMIL